MELLERAAIFSARMSLIAERQKRNLDAYKNLRARILKAHFGRPTQNGFEIDESWLCLDDLRAFKAPMYRFIINARGIVCIAWDADKMTEEIGSGQTGENAAQDDGTQNSSGEVLPQN